MKEYEFDYIISIRGTGSMYANSKDEVIDTLNSEDISKELKGKVFCTKTIDFFIEQANVEDLNNIKEI